jgi:hypothetical protein
VAVRLKKLPVHIYQHTQRRRTDAAHIVEIQHQETSANFRSELAESLRHECGLLIVKEDVVAGKANLNDTWATLHD